MDHSKELQHDGCGAHLHEPDDLQNHGINQSRISVKQIHAAIEPNMGISIRSLQRYLNGLVHWGLVAKDGETPQGFTLTDHAKQLFAELASGVDT